MLKEFIAAILRGLGSLTGAVAGGFALGFFEIYLAAYLPDHVQPYREALALGTFIFLLLLRADRLVPAFNVGREKA